MKTTRLFVLLTLLCLTAPHSQANPAAAAFGEWLLKEIAGNVVGDLYDSATGKPDVRAMQERLETAEKALSQASRDIARTDAAMSSQYAGMAAQLSSLRQELTENTSREHITGIVNEVLGKMEGRVNRLEIKVAEIEALFGYLPIVTPAPLLADRVAEGNPAVHPLMAEYARTLVQCETSRLAIAKMRQLYQDTAPELAAALEKDRGILTAVAQLNQKANAEFAKLLPERETLLKTYKPANPLVREMDARLASIAWLCGITRPLTEGPEKGRLPVPRDLLGPKCSDILIAFNLSAVKTEDLTPLFRHLLDLPVEGNPTGLENSIPLPPALAPHVAAGEKHAAESEKCISRAHDIQSQLQTALRDLSPTHPDVVKLQQAKSGVLRDAAALFAAADAFLNQAVADYVSALKETRPTASPMLQFRSGTLTPVARILVLCAGAGEPTEREDCWKRLLEAPASFTNSLGMKFVPVAITGGPTDGQKVYFCQHETRVKDFRAFAEGPNRDKSFDYTGIP